MRFAYCKCNKLYIVISTFEHVTCNKKHVKSYIVVTTRLFQVIYYITKVAFSIKEEYISTLKLRYIVMKQDMSKRDKSKRDRDLSCFSAYKY